MTGQISEWWSIFWLTGELNFDWMKIVQNSESSNIYSPHNQDLLYSNKEPLMFNISSFTTNSCQIHCLNTLKYKKMLNNFFFKISQAWRPCRPVAAASHSVVKNKILLKLYILVIQWLLNTIFQSWGLILFSWLQILFFNSILKKFESARLWIPFDNNFDNDKTHTSSRYREYTRGDVTRGGGGETIMRPAARMALEAPCGVKIDAVRYAHIACGCCAPTCDRV